MKMKKVQALILDEKTRNTKEVSAYRFYHNLACGTHHEFLTTKDKQGYWSIHEHDTGASLCGGSKTRKGIVEHLDWVLNHHDITKDKMITLTEKRSILNKRKNSTR